jgi:hypothetical protein
MLLPRHPPNVGRLRAAPAREGAGDAPGRHRENVILDRIVSYLLYPEQRHTEDRSDTEHWEAAAMMEIVYGPMILACATKSLTVGLLAMLLVQMAPSVRRIGLGGRLGLGFLAAGLFGIAHIAIVCSADGFPPPRIVQSTALALIVLAATGAVLMRRGRLTAA